jgi:hypothetical protein
METIKCPNCGHGKVQQISEEKYYCPACTTEFLVHNRSKEFQETDRHIESVHRDLKAAISNIVFSAGASDRDARFDNAFHLIEIGEYETAKKEFDSLCKECSNHYESWWGEILVLTKQFTELSDEIVCSDEMVLYINNMRNTKNYSKEIEKVLVQKLEEYFADARAETEASLEELKSRIESQNGSLQQMYEEQGTLSHRQEELQGIVNEERVLAGQARKRFNAIKNIIFAVILFLAEAKIISFFWKKVMKSVDVITQPALDPSDPEAGSAFGSAVLNFFSIPVKIVICIAVVVAVFWFLKLLFGIGENSESEGTEEESVQHSSELAKVSNQRADSVERSKNLSADIMSYTERQTMLEKKLVFYDSVDVRHPDTFLAWDEG